MTYANPIFNYGKDSFFAKCAETGVDSVIVPDVPFEERGEFAGEAARYGVDIIAMIAPTSKERIKEIAAVGQGFCTSCRPWASRGRAARLRRT